MSLLAGLKFAKKAPGSESKAPATDKTGEAEEGGGREGRASKQQKHRKKDKHATKGVSSSSSSRSTTTDKQGRRKKGADVHDPLDEPASKRRKSHGASSSDGADWIDQALAVDDGGKPEGGGGGDTAEDVAAKKREEEIDLEVVKGLRDPKTRRRYGLYDPLKGEADPAAPSEGGPSKGGGIGGGAGGGGLPGTFTPRVLTGVGDKGAGWRAKALKRAREKAEKTGQSLEELVGERWGSLDQLKRDSRGGSVGGRGGGRGFGYHRGRDELASLAASEGRIAPEDADGLLGKVGRGNHSSSSGPRSDRGRDNNESRGGRGGRLRIGRDAKDTDVLKRFSNKLEDALGRHDETRRPPAENDGRSGSTRETRENYERPEGRTGGGAERDGGYRKNRQGHARPEGVDRDRGEKTGNDHGKNGEGLDRPQGVDGAGKGGGGDARLGSLSEREQLQGSAGRGGWREREARAHGESGNNRKREGARGDPGGGGRDSRARDGSARTGGRGREYDGSRSLSRGGERESGWDGDRGGRDVDRKGSRGYHPRDAAGAGAGTGTGDGGDGEVGGRGFGRGGSAHGSRRSVSRERRGDLPSCDARTRRERSRDRPTGGGAGRARGGDGDDDRALGSIVGGDDGRGSGSRSRAGGRGRADEGRVSEAVQVRSSLGGGDARPGDIAVIDAKGKVSSRGGDRGEDRGSDGRGNHEAGARRPEYRGDCYGGGGGGEKASASGELNATAAGEAAAPSAGARGAGAADTTLAAEATAVAAVGDAAAPSAGKVLSEAELTKLAVAAMKAKLKGDKATHARLIEEARVGREANAAAAAAAAAASSAAPPPRWRPGQDAPTDGSGGSGGQSGNGGAVRAKEGGDGEEEEEEMEVITAFDEKGRPVRTGGAALMREDMRTGARKGKLKKVAGRWAGEAGESVEDFVRREREQGFEDMDETFLRNVSRLGNKFRGTELGGAHTGLAGEDEEEEVDMRMFQRPEDRMTAVAAAERQRAKAVADHRRQSAAASRCQFCMDSSVFKKRLVLSLGEHTYLYLATGTRKLSEGHCFIVPIRHTPASTACDEDVWREIDLFKGALRKMAAAAGTDASPDSNSEHRSGGSRKKHKKDKHHHRKKGSPSADGAGGGVDGVIFLETGGKPGSSAAKHAFIEAIPVHKNAFLDAPMYFRQALMESGEEWSTHKKCIPADPRRGGVRRAVPKGFPYFHVEWDDGGYAQIIEGEEAKFPREFGVDTLAGVLGVDPPSFGAKGNGRGRGGGGGGAGDEEEKNMVMAFLERWKAFDWTSELDGGEYQEGAP